MAPLRRTLDAHVSRLRAKLKYRPVVFELMAEEFTLTTLQRTVEALPMLLQRKTHAIHDTCCNTMESPIHACSPCISITSAARRKRLSRCCNRDRAWRWSRMRGLRR